MKQMGVTRALLREALMTMEGMGRLSIEGRSGILILRNGEEKIGQGIGRLAQWPSVLNDEILELRLILEVPAAEIAARVRNDADLEQMDQCLAALAAVDQLDEKDYARGDEWDFLLHQTIIRTTRNELLLRVYEGLASLMRDFTRRYRGIFFNRIEGWAESVFREHVRIVESIRRQDRKESGEAMRAHLCRLFNERRFWGDLRESPPHSTLCRDEARCAALSTNPLAPSRD